EQEGMETTLEWKRTATVTASALRGWMSYRNFIDPRHPSSSVCSRHSMQMAQTGQNEGAAAGLQLATAAAAASGAAAGVLVRRPSLAGEGPSGEWRGGKWNRDERAARQFRIRRPYRLRPRRIVWPG